MKTGTVRVARDIVEALLKDMNGRRGFRQNWDQIDEDVRNEIRTAWIFVVGEVLEKEPA